MSAPESDGRKNVAREGPPSRPSPKLRRNHREATAETCVSQFATGVYAGRGNGAEE